MLDEKFIESRKKFIAQFDGLVPKNGAQMHIKKVAEQYNENLDSLEEAQFKVKKMFKLSGVNKRKMDRHEAYPTEMNAYHTGRSALLGGLVITGVTLGVGTLLGGTNMTAWSSTLTFIGMGLGAVPAVPIALSSYNMSKKSFNRENVNKKKINWIERLVMKRVKKKERAFSLLATQIESNLPELLSGEFSMTEKKTIIKKTRKGNEKYKEVEKYKEEYKHLPFFTRMRLNRVIKGVNKEFQTLTAAEKELQARVEEIKAQKAKDVEVKPVFELDVNEFEEVRSNTQTNIVTEEKSPIENEERKDVKEKVIVENDNANTDTNTGTSDSNAGQATDGDNNDVDKDAENIEGQLTIDDALAQAQKKKAVVVVRKVKKPSQGIPEKNIVRKKK